MSKQNPYAFTLVFNPENPLHVKCVDILNRQGRSKSQFIAAAVVHYVDCNHIPASSLVQDQQLEELIARVVRKTIKEAGAVQVQIQHPPVSQNPAPVMPQPMQVLPRVEDLTDGDASALLDGLDVFRG